MQVSKWWMALIGHPCFLQQTVRLPLFVPSPLLQLALPDSGDQVRYFFPCAISNQHSTEYFTLIHPSRPKHTRRYMVNANHAHSHPHPHPRPTRLMFALRGIGYLDLITEKVSLRGSGWKKESSTQKNKNMMYRISWGTVGHLVVIGVVEIRNRDS